MEQTKEFIEKNRRKRSDRRKKLDRRELIPIKSIEFFGGKKNKDKIKRISPALVNLFGVEEKLQSIKEILSKEDFQRVKNTLFQRKNELKFVNFYPPNGRKFVFNVVTLKEKRSTRWYLEDASNGINTLTKLYNEKAFLQLATDRIKAARGSDLKAMLIYVDLNGFGKFNKIFADHTEGDKMIKLFSEVLVESFEPKNSIICHHHGDEFIILLFLRQLSQFLIEVTSKALDGKLKEKIGNQKINKRIRERITKLGYSNLDVTVSAGIKILSLSKRYSSKDLCQIENAVKDAKCELMDFSTGGIITKLRKTIKGADKEMQRVKEGKKGVIRNLLIEVDVLSCLVQKLERALIKEQKRNDELFLRVISLEKCIKKLETV